MKRLCIFIGLLLTALTSVSAFADLPGRHPAYLHALSDLRAAKWLIAHRPGDANVSADEDVALTEINAAIGELKKAAIEDGKDIYNPLPIDAQLDRNGRLHRAAELLKKVHSDVAREEDDPFTRGLQRRIVMHVDEATHATVQAIRDAEKGL